MDWERGSGFAQHWATWELKGYTWLEGRVVWYLVRHSWIVCPRLSVALPFASFPKTPHELETRQQVLSVVCSLVDVREEGILSVARPEFFQGGLTIDLDLYPTVPRRLEFLKFEHVLSVFCLILMYSSTSGTTTNTRPDPSIRRFTRRGRG